MIWKVLLAGPVGRVGLSGGGFLKEGVEFLGEKKLRGLNHVGVENGPRPIHPGRLAKRAVVTLALLA